MNLADNILFGGLRVNSVSVHTSAAGVCFGHLAVIDKLLKIKLLRDPDVLKVLIVLELI